MDCQADPAAGARLGLGWFTGMRISDCIAAPRQPARRPDRGDDRQDAVHHSRPAMVPEHPTDRILDAAPVTEAVTILTRARWPAVEDRLREHAFAKAVRAAWLPAGPSFHGLRKGITAALATKLAEFRVRHCDFKTCPG